MMLAPANPAFLISGSHVVPTSPPRATAIGYVLSNINGLHRHFPDLIVSLTSLSDTRDLFTRTPGK